MGATLGLTSCNDFLDMTPTDKISDKGVWTNVSTAVSYTHLRAHETS